MNAALLRFDGDEDVPQLPPRVELLLDGVLLLVLLQGGVDPVLLSPKLVLLPGSNFLRISILKSGTLQHNPITPHNIIFPLILVLL